jgi:hypothetical protein
MVDSSVPVAVGSSVPDETALEVDGERGPITIWRLDRTMGTGLAPQVSMSWRTGSTPVWTADEMMLVVAPARSRIGAS